MTIVDPMFSDQSSLDSKLQENYDWMKQKSRRKNENKFGKMRAEIIQTLSESKDEKEIAEAREELERYNERQLEIEEYVRRRKMLLKHLENRKDNQEKY